MLASRSETIAVRGLNLHVRHWGREGAPMLFMLHGWMDVSASFQFVVDELVALDGDWHVIAPDWRGFGLSQRTAGDTYWFADYVADLDAILRRYSPDRAVYLLGHSMGANIAGVYAGARPERIRKFINLEGVGMRTSTPDQAPGHYAAWLDQLGKPARMLTYPSRQAVAVRLQQNNPRLSDERAEFLSRYWAAQNDAGRWEILGDPLHRHASPLLYHVEEVMACWAAIKAPVLWVEASETEIWKWMGSKADARREVDRRLTFIADVTKRMIVDAGHMLHHDQPAVLAWLIVDFLP
jgi:pimeloyl-ACP methyl ester carboxylesterase